MLIDVTRAYEGGAAGKKLFSNACAYLMFFYGFIAISPIFPYLGWRGIYSIACVTFVFFAALILLNRGPNKKFLIIIFALAIPAIVNSVLWMDMRYALYPIFLIVSLMLVFGGGYEAINKLCSIATVFLCLILVGGWVAFFIALAGIEPIYEFANPDGRTNYFFHTSFTNSYSGNFIRASGIYDEPGTLSFFVCALSAVRHLLNKSKSITWLLLFLGFITFSLAHLIYIFFFFLSERFSVITALRFMIIFICLAAVSYGTGVGERIQDKTISRLHFDESGGIAGDNRSWRMLNAWEALLSSPSVVIKGIDKICMFEYDECKEKYPMMGENPLAPLVFGGVLTSFPYYYFILLFSFAPFFGRKYFAIFGVALLLSQRPYAMMMSFSLFPVLIAYLFVLRKKLIA